ncbi:IS3 family transposase [Clostridium rectalis]|uniref:IS3 family transposase n=1 Tax=Clostridium rectalis TaxID=2040295 RepID=UPI003C12B820
MLSHLCKLANKDEVDIKKCNTLEEVKSAIDSYIGYYNNYRYQWNNLNKMTPAQYRDHLV